ncbi:MAG: OmpA family protein [Rhodoglobus sp.]
MNKTTHPKPRRLLGILALLMFAASVTLAGCSSASEGQVKACDAFPGVIFVVSVHANVAAPDLTPELACRLEATIEAGAPVGIVTLDGTPDVLVPPTVLDIKANNPNAEQSKIKAAEVAVIGAIHGAKADSNGSDLMGALHLAADSAATSTPKVGQLVVLTSGLPDSGALRMTDPGMTEADPQEVVDYLTQSEALQADSFKDLSVQLVGFGYVTPPQDSLSIGQSDRVKQIFTAILTAGGAEVEVVSYPREGPGPKTKYTTKAVEAETTGVFTPSVGKTFVFGDTSPLRFQPDEAEFIDPAAAEAALVELAAWLAPGKKHHITVTGTTASGDPVWCQQLSEERAAAVKEVLVRLGADPSAIEPKGAGYAANPPDHDASGIFDPAAAALNRTVVISTDK